MFFFHYLGNNKLFTPLLKLHIDVSVVTGKLLLFKSLIRADQSQ